MGFTVDTFDLSLRNPETGLPLTANIYFVDGVKDATGAPRPLSIGQLVMALCLNRASTLEANVIALMEEMNQVSAELETMTEVEQAVVDYYADAPSNRAYTLSDHTIKKGPHAGTNYKAYLESIDVIGSAIKWVRDDQIYSSGDIMYGDFIANLEAKMDENNSFSQQKMIQLQSETSKRDQCYDMISNVLKSLNTVLVGNANNM